MSEFGRAARQNGNRGTDHGHGTCFFAVGGKINGGRVLGDGPGLAPENLFESRDLAVTTDFRDVFAEAGVRHFGVAQPDLGKVFPGYRPDPGKFRDFCKSWSLMFLTAAVVWYEAIPSGWLASTS